MPDEPDTDRLRALEARLAQVRKADKTEAPAKAYSQGEVAWRMVMEMVSGMLIGLSIGYGLDYWFGTMPLFLVIFVLLGFAAGIRTVMGTAGQLQQNQMAQDAADRSARNEG